MPDGQARPATMHEAAWDWLLTCPHVGELFFGVATAREGGTLLVPVTACMDSAETEFVDGSSIRNYDLTIVRFCLYTAAPDDRENLDALDDLAKLADWVAAQSAQGSYPVLPAGCTPLNVEALPGGDFFSAWDEGGAKYMLQIRIRYEKE